jgi:hypothetical protein
MVLKFTIFFPFPVYTTIIYLFFIYKNMGLEKVTLDIKMNFTKKKN